MKWIEMQPFPLILSKVPSKFCVFQICAGNGYVNCKCSHQGLYLLCKRMACICAIQMFPLLGSLQIIVPTWPELRIFANRCNILVQIFPYRFLFLCNARNWLLLPVSDWAEKAAKSKTLWGAAGKSWWITFHLSYYQASRHYWGQLQLQFRPLI